VPSSGEFVSTVEMQADVAGGDSNPSNNFALWNYATNLPHPDVKAAYMTRQTNANGSVKALFALLNFSQQDAPSVKLAVQCNYHSNATKQYTMTVNQTDTV